MSPSSVSIIVNTRGRAHHLRDALTGISQLDYAAFEIVVVADPSDLQTAAVLKSWAGRIKVVACSIANLSMSRNIGIAATSGEIIAFIDDDAVPHPKWLKHIVAGYRDDRVAGIGGYTVDNSGVSFQAKKTVCDRFGRAFGVSDWFDERPLCFPGAPLYPSLLGTNSTFRASALKSINGFDETYAYMLDETDVCLRLVDAGYRVLYEPEAIVFHQYAASHIRDERRIARTHYPSAVSTAYFMSRHGGAADHARAAREIDGFRHEILNSNRWFADHGEISREFRFSLDQDLLLGIADGIERATSRTAHRGGDLVLKEGEGFSSLSAQPDAMTICLVSQTFPPDTDAGIGRWTKSMADGLAERGHRVHVITRAWSGTESIHFQDGVWLHTCKPNGLAQEEVADIYELPDGVASWTARVLQEIERIKSFGLQVVIFPIWDLEAVACLDDPEITTIVTLQTTYALNKPFKPEWQIRPLFEALHVDRIIAAEKRCLERAPHILAISRAIIADLEKRYDVDIAARCSVISIGTAAPPQTLAERGLGKLKVVFVGRFEHRKGFDIAVKVAAFVKQRDEGIAFEFVGGILDEAALDVLATCGADSLRRDPGVLFAGVVSRSELDATFARADIVMMPSRYESFGIVAIEAMAAGTPVIALASGGLAEIVQNGSNGFAMPDDEQVVVRMSEKILELERDRMQLERLRTGARESFMRDYTIATMAQRIESFCHRARSEDAEMAGHA